jgi:aerobic-type carbon monoxide dehydrogenase small subunit (CoxS/CutS family)
MILEAVALLDEGVELTAEQIHRRMAGHLCKCGKGPEIVRAVMAAAQAMR